MQQDCGYMRGHDGDQEESKYRMGLAQYRIQVDIHRGDAGKTQRSEHDDRVTSGRNHRPTDQGLSQ